MCWKSSFYRFPTVLELLNTTIRTYTRLETKVCSRLQKCRKYFQSAYIQGCSIEMCRLFPGRWFPDPLPLGVAVVDSSLVLFGLVFPKVAHKHRLQILDHFSQHLRRLQSAAAGNSSSSNSNQSAVALHGNIVAALLAGVRGLVHAKVSLTGQEDVKKALTSIIFGEKCN